ncbi:unnamed protein product, partial [Amoebophrya sp. A120]
RQSGGPADQPADHRATFGAGGLLAGEGGLLFRPGWGPGGCARRAPPDRGDRTGAVELHAARRGLHR